MLQIKRYIPLEIYKHVFINQAKTSTKRAQHEVQHHFSVGFVATLWPYQGRLFAAVVRWFDVVATGRPLGGFER